MSMHAALFCTVHVEKQARMTRMPADGEEAYRLNNIGTFNGQSTRKCHPLMVSLLRTLISCKRNKMLPRSWRPHINFGGNQVRKLFAWHVNLTRKNMEYGAGKPRINYLPFASSMISTLSCSRRTASAHCMNDKDRQRLMS